MDLVQPPMRALEALPLIELNTDEVRRIGHGLSIADRFQVASKEIAAQDVSGNLVAILTPRELGSLGPLRNFPVG